MAGSATVGEPEGRGTIRRMGLPGAPPGSKAQWDTSGTFSLQMASESHFLQPPGAGRAFVSWLLSAMGLGQVADVL